MSTEAVAEAVKLSEPDIDLVKSGAKDIERFLAADPKAEAQLFEFLGRRLGGAIDSRTWLTVYPGLVTLLGDDGATLLAWTANTDPNPMEDVAKLVDAAMGLFIRRVMANFGPELRTAYEHGNELPHNWRYVSRDVFYDLIKGRPYIRFTVEQFNDDEVVLEGTADNMLALTRQLLITLRLVGAADAFDENAVSDFLDEFEMLRAVLRPESAPAQVVQAPVDANGMAPTRAEADAPVA